MNQARVVVAAIVAAFICIGATPAGAATITVNSTADAVAADSSCTLREAITAANTNAAFGGCTAGSGADTINFSVNGTLKRLISGAEEDGNAGGDFDLNSPITIDGNGPANTVIDADKLGRAFDTPGAADFAQVTLKNLKVVNGDGGASGGGAIRVKNLVNVTLDNVEASGNVTSADGGAVLNRGFLKVKRSYLHDNTASGAGGALAQVQLDEYSSMEVEDTTFETNAAPRGGAVYVNSKPATIDYIRRSYFTNNRATGTGTNDGGGAILSATGGDLYVRTSTLYANSAAKDGGAILGTGNTYAQYDTILGNSVDQGDGGNLRRVGGTFFIYGNVIARGVDNSTVSNSPDVSGAFSGGANFVGSTGGSTGVNGPFLGTNAARLNPEIATTPALNGGTTLNFLPTSNQLLDQGGICYENTDQRGVGRPINSYCDLGSVEMAITFVDHEPPDTRVLTGPPSPNNGSTALFTYDATDNDRVKGYQCWTTINGPLTSETSWIPCSASGYSMGAVGGSFPDGVHTFYVRAYDYSENVDPTPATYTWRVDRTPPVTTIFSRPPAISTSKSDIITWQSSDGDGVGLAQNECSFDGEPFSVCNSPRSFANLSEGAHTFLVRGVDGLGNTETAKSVTWTVDTIAPTTTLTKTPTNPSTAADAVFEFNASDAGGTGVDRIECALDTGTYSPCTSPKTYANIADGSHTLLVRAIDRAGNVDATPETYTWFNDSHAPVIDIHTKPPNPSLSAPFELAWSASDGNGIGGVTAECRLLPQQTTFAPCSPNTPLTGSGDGSRTYEVKAQDAYGNTATASYTFVQDADPPDTSINTKPTNPSTATDAAFTFSGSDAGTGVARLECSLDDAAYTTCTSPKTYTNVADGSHTFKVRAVDNTGKTDPATAEYTWFNDSHAPVIDVDTKPPDPSESANWAINWSVSDGAGIGGITTTCRLPGNPTTVVPCLPGAVSGTSPDGTYSIVITAKDAYDNTATESYSWTIDANPPDTSITATPSNPSTLADASFTFSGDDGGGTGIARLECSLDGAAYTTCTSSQRYTDVADGSHAFRVRAVDNTDKTDPTPAEYTWVNDTNAPTLTLTSTPDDPAKTRDYSFEWTTDDGDGSGGVTTECTLSSGGGPAPCTSPASGVVSADGTYTMQVVATDAAGLATTRSHTWKVDTLAPETTITAQPSDPSTSPSASFSFGGDDGSGVGLDRLECRIDSGAWETCTTGQTYVGLADGAHTFEVRAVDELENTDATPASYTWVVDANAPVTTLGSTPPNPSTLSSGSIAFNASDPTGGTGVSRSECRLDGGSWTTCTTPFAVTSLIDGSHTVEIRSVDGAGNVESTPASYTWTVDAGAPDTSIDTQPSDPSTSTGATFAFSGSDPAGGTGVSRFECSLDSAAFTTCSTGETYSALDDGNHTFRVRAVDGIGLADPTPASYTWVVDANAPNTTIGAKPAAVSTTTGGSISFSAADAGTGVKETQCRIDSAAFAPCTSPYPFSGLSEAAHTFEVRSVDHAGHVESPAKSYTWMVDTTPPSVNITSKPGDPSLSDDASFEWAATDAVAVDEAQCSLDGSSFATCPNPKSYSDLTDGSHTFKVRAKDTAGNTSGEETYSWTVDANDPKTTLTLTPAALMASPDARFEFSGADGAGGSGVAEFRCSIDGAAATVCTSPLDLKGAGDGEHTLTVAARDAVGRDDPTPASWTWKVDTTPPTTEITAGPPAFTFTGSDGAGAGVDAFECKVDGGGFAACASPLDLSRLAVGDHTLEVRAVDKLGHRDATPATRTWTVTAPPAPPPGGGQAPGGGGQTPGGEGETPLPPAVATHLTISHLRLRMRSNRVEVKIRCRAAAGSRCTGKLTLKPTSKSSRRDRLALTRAGQARIDIAAGATKTIRIEPTAKLVSMLKKRGRVVAQVQVALHGVGSRTFERLITVL